MNHPPTNSTPHADSTAKQAARGATRVPRVAVVTNSVTPYRRYLHERLVAEVPEVELWTLTTHGNAYQRWSGLDVPESIRPVAFGSGEPTNEQTQLKYSRREWAKAGRIIRWLSEHQVDAVLCQGCGDFGRLRILRWCRRNNVPCFLTGDFNVRSEKLSGVKQLLKTLTYRHAVKQTTGLMPCGRHGAELLARYGGDSKPVFWFPFFPDVELLRETPPDAIEQVQRKFPFLASSQRRMIFSARMMPVKRPDLAIKAFARIASQHPNWDLVMIGDGPLRGEAEAAVPVDCQDRIHFTGFVNDPIEMAGIYACGDALVLPSDDEPWGVVVVEAAASGMAIVASDVVGAVPELVVEGRNGHTFVAGDVDGLADALRQVAAESSIDRMRAQSLEVFEEWLTTDCPVRNFRQALAACGVLETATGPVEPGNHAEPPPVPHPRPQPVAAAEMSSGP